MYVPEARSSVAGSGTDQDIRKAIANGTLHRWIRFVPAGGATVAIPIALMVLVGWQFRNDFLKNPFGALGSSYMTANAALLFILSGVALLRLQKENSSGPQYVGTGAALFVLISGLLTLAEYLGGWDFGIDRLFFHHRLSDWAIPGSPPGRFALNSAIAFPVLALALLFRGHRVGWRKSSDWLAFVVTYISYLNVIGYTFHVKPLEGLGSPAPMAMHTALCFAVLGVGVLLTRPEEGFAATLLSRDSEGSIVRQLLATIAFGLPVLGWLSFRARENGLVDQGSAVALLVVIAVSILSLFIFRAATSLHEANQDRRLANIVLSAQKEELHRANDRLSRALDAARGGAWDWDLKTREAWWSPEMYALWGVPSGTPLNEANSMAMVDDRDRAQLKAALASAVKQHLDGRYEFRIMHPQKGERWMASFARPFYDEHGEPERMLGVTLDVTERKLAEEQIRQSAEVLEQFVEYAPASLAMFDRNMCYMLASRRWREDCGAGREELIGKCHYDVFPDLPEHWKEAHRRGLAGESLEGEDDWTALDGQKHCIRWGIHPWGDSGQHTGGIIIFLEDTTERRKVDAALRGSEQQLRTIFENAAVGVAQIALDGRYLRVNERFCKQLGYSPAELIDKNSREVTHPDDLVAESDLLQALVCGDTDRYSLEKRFVRKDGSPIWTTVTRSIARNDAGRPLYMVSVVEDITRRKETEAASVQLMESLAHSEQRFRAIFENASIGIEQVALDGRLLMVNSALCEMLGYSSAELLARTSADITEPEDVKRESVLLAELLQGQREECGIDKRYLRSDGKPVWVHVQSRMVRDEEGQPAYRISAVHDISDRQRAEKAMRMAERISAANKLAGALAHEIVNSLMAIGNVFYLLDLDASIQSESKVMLALAEQELSHVDEITKRALMVSRGSGQASQVALPEMVAGMVELYGAHIRRSEVRVETRYRLERDAIIDTGVIKQVFTNLLTNALDAMPDGGRLRIDLYRSRSRTNGRLDGVRLVVADTGTGISTENMVEIFDPFFTTKGERGTGLGLWVTRGLIVKAGGSIRIRSSQFGAHSGTCISVFLPCSFAEQAVTTLQSVAGKR